MVRGTQLVVCATVREADAVAAGLGPAVARADGTQYLTTSNLLLVACGIGMAEAAAATARVLAREPVAAVFSLGVAGGFGVPVGEVAVGTSVSRADTGIEQADGTVRTTREALDMGDSTLQLGDDLVDKMAARLPGAHRAHVLTVATVTGTAERAKRVLARKPHRGSAVEDMEAWGVAVACRAEHIPFFAVKAVSNTIGPRDKTAWRLTDALDALSRSAFRLFIDPPDWI